MRSKKLQAITTVGYDLFILPAIARSDVSFVHSSASRLSTDVRNSALYIKTCFIFRSFAIFCMLLYALIQTNLHYLNIHFVLGVHEE